MIVVIKHKQLSVFLKDDHGMHHRLVFAEMADDCARQLVREYGYRPEWVYALIHEEVVYQHPVDDSLVEEVLSRLPQQERRVEAVWLAAVRTIVPQAERIVRLRGCGKLEMKYINE